MSAITFHISVSLMPPSYAFTPAIDASFHIDAAITPMPLPFRHH